MVEFENPVVKAFNRYFDEKDLTGYAYRRKQSRFTSQIGDVLVDSPDIGYHVIECKSKKAEYGKRLNFKSAFPETDEGHQIPRTKRFAEKTGRTPLLAVEYRHGRGKPKEAAIYEWQKVEELYHRDEAKSIGPQHLKKYKYNLIRDGAQYNISEEQ